VAVNSTVCAEMLPELELVRLAAAIRLKSEPADEAPETLTLPLSLMFTSPAALALKFATAVLSAVADAPTLPAVDVTFKTGVVIVPKFEFVISPLDVSDTDVLPLTLPTKLSAPPVAVSSTVLPEMLPPLELDRFVPAVIDASPVAVTAALFVIEPVAEKLTEPAVIVPEVTRLPVSVIRNAPPTVDVVTVDAVSLTVALPLVEALNEPALVFAIVISPLPDASVKVPVEMALPLAA
jgi:hypothetical protein